MFQISDDLNVSGKVSYTTVTNSVTVATYAAMLTIGSPTAGSTVFKVLVDENKGVNHTTYEWWSTGKRMWIAANEDN